MNQRSDLPPDRDGAEAKGSRGSSRDGLRWSWWGVAFHLLDPTVLLVVIISLPFIVLAVIIAAIIALTLWTSIHLAGFRQPPRSSNDAADHR
jgi:hypothetical protein